MSKLGSRVNTREGNSTSREAVRSLRHNVELGRVNRRYLAELDESLDWTIPLCRVANGLFRAGKQLLALSYAITTPTYRLRCYFYEKLNLLSRRYRVKLYTSRLSVYHAFVLSPRCHTLRVEKYPSRQTRVNSSRTFPRKTILFFLVIVLCGNVTRNRCKSESFLFSRGKKIAISISSIKKNPNLCKVRHVIVQCRKYTTTDLQT